MRAVRVLFGVGLLWCAIGASVAMAQVVREIEVQGNRKIETDAIKSKINTAIGTSVDADLIREDILAVHSLGYFDHIEVEELSAPGGVKLIYRVREKPTIAAIVYEGLDELDEDEAKEQTEVKAFEVLDIHKLNVTVEKLTGKYEEKGYYLADVRYEIKLDEAKNDATITFKIEENDKIQVKKINIIGNKVIPDEDLKAVMQTQEGGFFSWITGSGSYREAVFERDIAGLGFFYGTKGYVRARFGRPEVTVSADRKWVYITFYLDEGAEYKVGEMDFRGDLLFSRDELLEDLSLVQGEVFNADTLRRETLRYTEKYSDLGYAFANVIPQPIIHDDTLTVDVVFEVDKGERVYVGEITITGNTKTKDKVIRRELMFYEGEIFNGTKKRLSRENVLRLGFFESVEFHQSTSKSASDVVDIEIRIKERSTGQLVIGAGYASGNIGFTFNAQLSQNNFLGNGQVASLSAEVMTGRKLYQFNLGFTEPHVGYSNWSLGGDLYNLRRTVRSTKLNVDTYEENKVGFDARLGHPIMEFTNLFLKYKIENSYIDGGSIIDPKIVRLDELNGITSSVTASVVYDKRDDRFDPRNGWYWSLASEFAGIGGLRRFWKNTLETKFFHPLIWEFVFRSQFKAGALTQVGGRPIPINELFIMGGIFDLRGYDVLSIGPKDTLSTNLSANALANGLRPGDEIVVGGNYQLLANLEIEFPILKSARIRGVVFFDAGSAFNNSTPTIYADVGWGIRWFTPIGPLRFEFGSPIVGGTGIDMTSKFQFTIGPPF